MRRAYIKRRPRSRRLIARGQEQREIAFPKTTEGDLVVRFLLQAMRFVSVCSCFFLTFAGGVLDFAAAFEEGFGCGREGEGGEGVDEGGVEG